VNALVPIRLPSDWFIDRPVDFAFGITAEPQRTDPYDHHPARSPPQGSA